MALYSGKFGRVVLDGGVTLASVKWTALFSAEEVDDSSFEDAPYKRVRPGMRQCEITVEGFWEAGLHFFPPDLKAGNYVEMRIFPDAQNLQNQWFYFPLVLVLTLSVDAEVRGMIKYTMTGKSDGSFSYFGNNINVLGT